jgi:hypothetical protein
MCAGCHHGQLHSLRGSTTFETSGTRALHSRIVADSAYPRSALIQAGDAWYQQEQQE